MQPQTKPIAAVFGDETQLDVMIKTEQRQQFSENSPVEPAVAVWITKSRQLEPLQATGGWLGRPGTQ